MPIYMIYLTETIDEGRWHNDIKKATVKCKVEYGLTQSIVSPYPTDLAGMGVVSQNQVLTTNNR